MQLTELVRRLRDEGVEIVSMKYAATLSPDEGGGFIVTFRDIPEAITHGENEVDALEMAKDALTTAMDFYFEDRRAVPAPSPQKHGEQLVELPLSVVAKVLLLNEFLASDIRPAELARRMGIKPQEVTRVLDFQHTTKIDTIQAALHALGRDLKLTVCH